MDLYKTSGLVETWLEELGDYQLEKQYRELNISTKENPADLVTQVDQNSEKWLVEKIHSHFPQHSIWGEEGGYIERDPDYLWVMDPLDGTMNYTHGLPIFGISLALQHKGETILGAIHFPRFAETFSAVKGNGAKCNGKKIRVSSEENPRKSLLGIAIPYSKIEGKIDDDYLAPFHSRFRGIRIFGCVVFDLCQVASGNLECSLSLKMNPWDVLAGILIIEEAGGSCFHRKTENNYSVLSANSSLLARLEKDIAFTRLLNF